MRWDIARTYIAFHFLIAGACVNLLNRSLQYVWLIPFFPFDAVHQSLKNVQQVLEKLEILCLSRDHRERKQMGHLHLQMY